MEIKGFAKEETMKWIFGLVIATALYGFSKEAFSGYLDDLSAGKSRPVLVATAGKIEEAPQKFAGSDVQLQGADLSLAFREFESSDEALAPFTTAQINGRGHVRGAETKFIFLIPDSLRQNLLREHEKGKTIHADILVRVRAQRIPKRGADITHVGDILKVVEVEPK